MRDKITTNQCWIFIELLPGFSEEGSRVQYSQILTKLFDKSDKLTVSGRAEKYFKYYDDRNEWLYFQNPQRYNKHIFVLYEMNSLNVNKKSHDEMVTNFIKYLKIIMRECNYYDFWNFPVRKVNAENQIKKNVGSKNNNRLNVKH